MMRFNRKLTLTAVAAAALIALAGCSGGGSSKPAGGGGEPFGNVAKGKEVYASTCVSCHGPDAKGMPGLGKSLATASDWMKKQTDEQLLEFMKTGRSASDPENTTKVDMPPKGGNPALSEQDLKDVIAYMRSLQK
ncbi:MAG: c-type cytochrome [Bacillota bacterium]